MTEKAQKVKQDLINLANNLDSAEGVIVLKGMNTGDMNDFDMFYYEANPLCHSSIVGYPSRCI